MSEPIIEVKDLTYSYNSKPVIDHISFDISEGSYVGIIGPNGGGKTTLLKLLLGLIQPDKGSIKILGHSVNDLRRKYQIGYVPQRVSQDNMQFPATVEEVVLSGRIPHLSLFEFYKAHDKTEVSKAMEIANVKKFRHKLLSDLSGGERQRVYVARALASEPKILLLDEPFVGIDLPNQQEFYSFLKVLNQEYGLTILFVSHDIDIISNEVTELLCLNRRLVCQGKTDSVIEGSMIEELYGKKVTHIHHG
jgi:zinc transport system ATP-binding protein